MPSQLPLPTAADYVTAFHRGVKGKRDKRADAHTGSVYDYVAGTSAMLLARGSAFIRDLFRANYFDDAEGDDLASYVAARFQIARILDGYGTGTLSIRRPTAAAGGDTLWQGTRIQVSSGTGSAFYAIAADTPVAAGALTVAGIPVRATVTGPGVAVDTGKGGLLASLADPIWDPSFTVTRLTCSDGTSFEKAPDFRARVRAILLAATVGSKTAMVNACIAAGATNVAIFGPAFGQVPGTDLGRTAVYVGDASFSGTSALVAACTVALESWRMLGADLQVGAMAPSPIPLVASVQLYDDPAKFDTNTLLLACQGALRNVFGATGAYGYDLNALFGALVDVSDEIQNATFTSPASSIGLLTGTPLFFPQTLTRYTVSGITLTFTGPP